MVSQTVNFSIFCGLSFRKFMKNWSMKAGFLSPFLGKYHTLLSVVLFVLLSFILILVGKYQTQISAAFLSGF